MSSISFQDLPLSEELQFAVLEAGFSTPTPIQAKVIPAAIAGSDVIAAAPTGSGKSAAFLLPIINTIRKERKNTEAGKIRALIVTPTRELATQTRDFVLEFGSRLNIKTTVVVGGTGISPQLQELRRGTDIVIATPGRAIELLEREAILLNNLDVFVLDEVDRMLQMGFIHDISRIATFLPQECQALFFSATIDEEVAKLAGRLLHSPFTVDVKKKSEQKNLHEHINYFTIFCDKGRKRKTLLWLLEDIQYKKVLIFVNSKGDAERLGRDLETHGLKAGVIHGDKNNHDRELIMDRFKRKLHILIATDVASRGVDARDVTHVIQYDVPHDLDTFFHRTGRTGRAGAEGTAFTLCDQFDRNRLFNITKRIDEEIEVFPWHPYHSDKVQDMTPEEAQEREERERHHAKDRDPDPKKEYSKGKGKEKEKEEDDTPKAGERKTKGIPFSRAKKKEEIAKKHGKKTTGKGLQKKNRPSYKSKLKNKPKKR